MHRRSAGRARGREMSDRTRRIGPWLVAPSAMMALVSGACGTDVHLAASRDDSGRVEDGDAAAPLARPRDVDDAGDSGDADAGGEPDAPAAGPPSGVLDPTFAGM